MKIKLFASMIAALFLLTACGGGGGGGGGGRGSDPVVYREGTALHYTALPRTSGFSVARSEGGTLSISAGDFQTYSGDARFVSAVKTAQGDDASRPGVKWTATDTVIMGGGSLNLQYSDFGIWNSAVNYTQNGEPVTSGLLASHTYTPILADVNGANKAHFSGTGVKSFSGTTVAVARGGGKSGSDTLTGTATLNVDLNNLAGLSTNLKLDLTNFYTFVIPLSIDGSGGITQRGAASVTDNGDTTGRSMGGVGTTLVNGQFYGPTPTSPSEAVGSYLLQSNDPQYTSVNGSFGVTAPSP